MCESGLQAAEEEHFSGKHQPMVPLAGSHKGGLHGEAGKTGEMRNYMGLELFFALQSLAVRRFCCYRIYSSLVHGNLHLFFFFFKTFIEEHQDSFFVLKTTFIR